MRRQLGLYLLALSLVLGGIQISCGGGSSPPPLPISVSLSNASATVQVSATMQFTATVANDSSNRGVTWTLTQGGTSCSPGCGTVAPESTPSGTPTTYTAPTVVPANSGVTITATSVADSTKSATAKITITPPNPVPLVNQPLVPEAAVPGGAGFTLTVNGTGFVSGSVVKWNGSASTTNFVNGSQLTASIPASDIATAGTASVTVVNPGPGGGTSNIDFFQVTSPSGSVTFAISTQASNEFTQRMVAADLNGDGKLDLVGVNGSNTFGVTVRLGNGDGTFQPEVDYATACGGDDVLVRDFNGDGKLDIAVICPGFVSVLLGNGDGTFQNHRDSPIDSGLHDFGIAAGDFNGDGKLDVVVGYQDPASNSVSVLIGKGDGTFQPPVDYATGNEPGAVTVADLNHDGKLDIVAANFGQFGGNTVSVLLGNGDGTFKTQVQYTTSNGALSVIAADFDGDGNLDLAVDCSCGSGGCPGGNSGAVSILLGNGDGTFRSHVDYVVSAFPYTVSSGDYNGDGKLDLLIPDLNTNQVSLLLGNGDGTFSPAVVYGPTGIAPVGVAPGDFNGDGKLDAVIGTAKGFTTLLQ